MRLRSYIVEILLYFHPLKRCDQAFHCLPECFDGFTFIVVTFFTYSNPNLMAISKITSWNILSPYLYMLKAGVYRTPFFVYSLGCMIVTISVDCKSNACNHDLLINDTLFEEFMPNKIFINLWTILSVWYFVCCYLGLILRHVTYGLSAELIFCFTIYESLNNCAIGGAFW